MLVVFKEFASRTKLPIKVNEIADFIIQRGFVRRIAFHAFEGPAEEGVGMLIMREDLTAYVSGEFRAEIAYCSAWSPAVQRIVCAKELLHICDFNGVRAETKEEVSRLLTEVCMPIQAFAELQKKISPQGGSDHGGWLFALAILVPRDAQAILKDLYGAGKIGENEVAEIAEIPTEYVPLIMSDQWSELLKMLCGEKGA